MTAQLARRPLLDDDAVGTDVTIGASAVAPLRLEIPLFVSDMSFGALSQEAKVALARGAERAGTGICSGEGGMLDEERQENSRYFYELASARFGWSLDKVRDVQAFHFKFGQGAKTGTGGHLRATKVVGRIAEVRGLPEGTDAVSPATFPDLRTVGDFRDLAAQVRETSGGIPIGAKLSAQHIEADLDAALEIGVDYVILDGRGGGTGAAPAMFRDHISVPTIPALARARRHLDACDSGVTLVITGGLRTHVDFVKALALGADAVAISNSALQAIGCLGMRACNTDNCPVGIATQKPGLRQRLVVEDAARRLTRFLESTVELMQVLARACGHAHLSDLVSRRPHDLRPRHAPPRRRSPTAASAPDPPAGGVSSRVTGRISDDDGGADELDAERLAPDERGVHAGGEFGARRQFVVLVADVALERPESDRALGKGGLVGPGHEVDLEVGAVLDVEVLEAEHQ